MDPIKTFKLKLYYICGENLVLFHISFKFGFKQPNHKLFATGNLARDGLIEVVSVYWQYLYLVLLIPIRY